MRIGTYTDQELDSEVGLYNYNARLYDPALGIFISPDRIVPNVYDPQSLNRFTYARNNPLKYNDPDGHAFVLAIPLGVAAFEAAAGTTLGITIGVVVGGWLSDVLSASNDTPVPGSVPGERTKGRTENWEVPEGDLDRANEDFDEFQPDNVDTLEDGTRIGTLPDGRSINVRKGENTTDGRPTVEIQQRNKRGKVTKRTKIRYGEKPQDIIAIDNTTDNGDSQDSTQDSEGESSDIDSDFDKIE